jgi:hypothetical protein
LLIKEASQILGGLSIAHELSALLGKTPRRLSFVGLVVVFTTSVTISRRKTTRKKVYGF